MILIWKGTDSVYEWGQLTKNLGVFCSRDFLSTIPSILLNDSYLFCLVNFDLFLAFEIIYLKTCTISPGGHKGDKDGYTIPAGTDLFISVSTYICDTLFHCEEVDITDVLILWLESFNIVHEHDRITYPCCHICYKNISRVLISWFSAITFSLMSLICMAAQIFLYPGI